MSIERNAEALIALVDGAADRRARAIVDTAHGTARTLRSQAYREARSALRASLVKLRQLARDRVGAAESNLENRRRLAAQRRNAALVAAAWQRLPDALVAQWRNPAARSRWIARTLDDARAALPADTWQVVYPEGWAADERERLAEAIARATGHVPSSTAGPELAAGISIESRGTRVDATPAGLLADRTEIGAAVLARFEAFERELAKAGPRA